MSLVTSHGTLVANTVTAVTIDRADLSSEVWVHNRHSTADLWVSVDAVVPAIAGAGSVCVPAQCVVRVDSDGARRTGSMTVRLISASAVPYSVVAP